MANAIFRWSLNLVTFGCLIWLYFLFSGQHPPSLSFLTGITGSEWQGLKTVFVSIFLEALPFILLGVLVSSFLHLFVSEDSMRKFMPRNPVLGVVYACLLGVFLPVCECGMIPIVRRLIGKGMPVYIGVTYVLAAPVINPVTYAATAMAFRADPEMVYSRLGLAFAVALAVGLVLYAALRENPLRTTRRSGRHDHSYDDHNHHHHDHEHPHRGNRYLAILTHASDEFFEMGKYLLLGSFLTAVIQTFVSRSALVSFSGDAWGSHLLMMGFAYLISLCSTSDAFVAASFSGTFSKGALLSFLVFGPMVDFKNTLMMLSVFRSRFVLKLIVLIAILVFLGSIVAERLLLYP
ncbi:permease [Cohnella caldifontis]|uniref:permease n=1 Tax=Cohnella caldifontis TaxID=3027471 RepID=UPI0023EC575C|nr:permease [Cohnella sp. YIM B05605]